MTVVGVEQKMCKSMKILQSEAKRLTKCKRYNDSSPVVLKPPVSSAGKKHFRRTVEGKTLGKESIPSKPNPPRRIKISSNHICESTRAREQFKTLPYMCMGSEWWIWPLLPVFLYTVSPPPNSVPPQVQILSMSQIWGREPGGRIGKGERHSKFFQGGFQPGCGAEVALVSLADDPCHIW